MKDLQTHSSQNSHDKELFKEFINDLPSTSGSIEFIREHDFHNSFKLSKLDELREFARKWDNAEYEFINHDLENPRNKLLSTIFEFIEVSSLNTFSEGDGWQTSIPKYLENGDIPPTRKKAIEKMNALGDDIFIQHQTLVRAGKNNLNT